MMHLNSRISALFLISIFLFPQSIQVTKGCGGWDEDDIIDTSMFIPELIEDTRFDPFFLSIWDYYNPEITEGRIIPNSKGPNDYNMEEWQAYFGGIPQEDIYHIVYKQSISAMDTFLMVCDKKITNPGEPYRFAAGKKHLMDGFEYLKYAKKLEQYLYVDAWEYAHPAADSKTLKSLGEELIRKFRSISNKSLRMRYGFQYTRVCHAIGAYNEGIRFVDAEYRFLPSEGFMYYRTMGYKAACHYRLKQYAQANILYARLYDLGEAFKFEAFQSFHPQNETEWNQTLSLAANLREKEVLWHLFGAYVDPLRGMKEIAKLNPSSDLLPLLLVRSVNIAENNIVSNPLYGQMEDNQDEPRDYYDDDNSYTVDGLYSWDAIHREQLASLIETIEKIGSLRGNDMAVWTLSNAYLFWIQGDKAQCQRYTDEAEKQGNGNALIDAQIAINRILLAVDELNVISEQDEAKILQLIQTLMNKGKISRRHDNALRFVLRKMKSLYENQGNPLLAELSEPNIYAYYDSELKIREMIDFMLDQDKSAFRNYLQGRYPIQLPDLYDVLATARIYHYNFEGAREVYQQHPQAGLTELLGNPFNYRKVDCHDCDHALPQKVKYTKRSFVDKMLELKHKGETETDAIEKSTNYFLYANGLYNMTYYGNARLVSTSVVNWDYNDYYRFSIEDRSKRRNSGYYDCSEALNYYLKAIELNPKPEFKAKCTWMAAKCEHNLWLESEYKHHETGDFQSGKYFKLMKENYANTKYYTEVINECGYFCQYINPGRESCIKNK